MSWEFSAELFPWTDWESSWVFVVVPEEVGEEIAGLSGPRRGFGSVRVEVRIGTSVWRTSVFPDKRRGYVLPVKKDVRRRQALDVGDVAHVVLRLV